MGLGNYILSFARCTNDGDAFRHHHLVPCVRMKVSGAHKTGLSGMRVYPSKYHQVFPIHKVEQLALVDRLTCIRGAFLIWDDKLGDEESIGDERAAQYATRFEIRTGIWQSEREEAETKIWRQEDRPQRCSILKISRRLEGESGRFHILRWWGHHVR